MPIRTLLLVLLAAASLSACGRRGPLEAPPGPEASAVTGQPVPANVATQGEPAPTPGSGVLSDQQSLRAGAFPDQQSPGSQEPAEAAPVEGSRSGFFLDPLI